MYFNDIFHFMVYVLLYQRSFKCSCNFYSLCLCGLLFCCCCTIDSHTFSDKMYRYILNDMRDEEITRRMIDNDISYSFLYCEVVMILKSKPRPNYSVLNS